jgi:hypothetical protein
MSFLLLGIDSLIAGIAIGGIVTGRMRLPLAALFGVADGVVFLIGAGIISPFSDGVSTIVQTVLLLAMGIYLIVVAAGVRRVASSWPMWVLPFVLTFDNLAYGLAGDKSASSLFSQAGQQALSSALLALIGLTVGAMLPRLVPSFDRRVGATRFAGAALIVAAGALLLVG